MSKTFIHIIYLHPDVSNDRWSYLHRFFHPGILEHDKKTAMVCFSLDMTHHAFLSAHVREFSSGKNKSIHIPYHIVDAMIELPPDKTQIGFLHSMTTKKEKAKATKATKDES